MRKKKHLSSAIKEALLNHVADGGTVISFLSCHRPGFSRAHFYRELRKDLSFAQHFALAIEIGADTIAEEILTIVDEQTIHIDQPYYSPLSDNEYVRRYHFVEGLAGDWQDVEIQEHTVPKKFKSYSTPFSSRKGAAEAFDMLFKRFRESVLVVSYSSNSCQLITSILSATKGDRAHR
jgi:adenine-specific DNA methylase